jgi:hypothetical protein
MRKNKFMGMYSHAVINIIEKKIIHLCQNLKMAKDLLKILKNPEKYIIKNIMCTPGDTIKFTTSNRIKNELPNNK